MKKDLIKGVVIGCALTLTVTFGAAAIAESIGVDLNLVRIMKGNETAVVPSESYTLHNGDVVPHSILYRGTTYLPIRRISDIMNNTILWNGDTSTVTMINGRFKEGAVLTRKPDSNGNSWYYQICETTQGQYFLVLNDSVRGFDRAYELASEGAYKLEDDSIVFITPDSEIKEIYFNCDIDAQDGSMLNKLPDEEGNVNTIAMQDGKVYLVQYIQYGFALEAYNFVDGETEILARHTGGPMGDAKISDISAKNGYIYYTAEDHWGNMEKYRVRMDGSEPAEKA